MKIDKLAGATLTSAKTIFFLKIQYTLDLRKPDLRKNLDLRKIAGATDFLVHKLFDLRKIFKGLMFDLRKISFQKVEKIGTFW